MAGSSTVGKLNTGTLFFLITTGMPIEKFDDEKHERKSGLIEIVLLLEHINFVLQLIEVMKLKCFSVQDRLKFLLYWVGIRHDWGKHMFLQYAILIFLFANIPLPSDEQVK